MALINLPGYECIKFIFGDLVNIFSQFPQFLNRISPRWRAMSWIAALGCYLLAGALVVRGERRGVIGMKLELMRIWWREREREWGGSVEGKFIFLSPVSSTGRRQERSFVLFLCSLQEYFHREFTLKHWTVVEWRYGIVQTLILTLQAFCPRAIRMSLMIYFISFSGVFFWYKSHNYQAIHLERIYSINFSF